MSCRLCLIVLMIGSALFASASEGGKRNELGWVKRLVRGFSAIETNYIEPQHYNFTVMLQY